MFDFSDVSNDVQTKAKAITKVPDRYMLIYITIVMTLLLLGAAYAGYKIMTNVNQLKEKFELINELISVLRMVPSVGSLLTAAIK